MFKSFAGPLESDENLVYLRPETAQAMFVQFKNVLETSRQKLPFGIAQIGKAFRNEINPRNYTFRSREFEQMEIEYFCRAEEGLRLTDYWLEERLRFYEDIGIPRSKIRVHEIPDGERAFYSKKTYDLEYEFPFGVSELEGIAYRTDYDLSRHIECSGKPLEYFDEETKQKFVPHVVEPSAGVDRTALALLCEAFDEETVMGEKRQKRNTNRPALSSAYGTGKVRRVSPPEEQAGTRRQGQGNCHRATSASFRLLRRQRGDRPALSPPGRSGHTIRNHGGF